MTDKTNRLKLTFLQQYQSHKEIIVNQNFSMLDILINNCVQSRSETMPINPTHNNIYIVPKNAHDEWSIYANHIAIFIGQWEYIPITNGMMFWIEDEQALVVYSQNQWLMLFQQPIMSAADRC